MFSKKKGIVFFDIDDTLVDTTNFLYGDEKYPGSFKYAIIKLLSDTDFQKKYNIDFNRVYQRYLSIYRNNRNGQDHYAILLASLGLNFKEMGYGENNPKKSYLAKLIFERHQYKKKYYIKYKREKVDKVLKEIEKMGYELGIISEGLEVKQKEKLTLLKLTSFFRKNIEILPIKSDSIYKKISREKFSQGVKYLWMVGDKENKDILPAKRYNFVTIKIYRSDEGVSNNSNYELSNKNDFGQIIDAIKDYETRN